MTFVTLTPNATTASTGALTGSSVHAALSDVSDSTYVTYDIGEYSTVSFSDLSLPSGAQLVSAQLKFRCAKSGSGSGGLLGQLIADDITASTGSVTWTSPQELNSAFQFGGLTDGGLDGASASFTCTSAAQVIVYEASVSVLYLAKPTATVSGPSGTISTNLATVTWSGSYDVHTTSAPAYSDVKVFSSAQYSAGGFSPSTSTPVCASGVEYGSSLSRAFSERLPDGAYRAYVRVAPGNASSLWSDWDYEAFTVSASLPDEPTIELSGENSSGRIRIDVECGADTDSVQVQRDSGDGFVNVRTADGDGMVALTDAGTVFDYEAPNGVSCDYRVRAYDESNATFSDWVEGSASWSSDDAWLKCVGDPSLNLSLTARSYEGFEVPANQGVFRVLGASEATVVQDTPGPMSGRVVFMTRSEDDRVALGSLLGSGSPVLLQVNGHPDRLVSLGDRSSTRLADHGWVEEHDDSLVWTVVGEDNRVIGVGIWGYADTVPLTDLEVFWSLGETDGFTDRSGNDRDGTTVGVVTPGPDGPLAVEDDGASLLSGGGHVTADYGTRSNMITDPGFENVGANWWSAYVSGTSAADTSTTPLEGEQCGQITSTNTPSGSGRYFRTPAGSADTGQTWRFSIWAKAQGPSDVGKTIFMGMQECNSSGTGLSGQTSTATMALTEEWQELVVERTFVHADADRMDVRVVAVSNAFTWSVDCAVLERIDGIHGVLDTGNDIQDSFAAKADGQPTVADSGQSYFFTQSGGSDAALRVVSGKLTHVLTSGSGAGYGQLTLPAPVRRIGAEFEFGSGSTGSAIIFVALENSISGGITGGTQNAALHVVIGPSSWAIQVIENGSVSSNITAANYLTTLSADTAYKAECYVSGTQILVRLPDGTMTVANDPRFAQWDCPNAIFEVMQTNAATQAKPKFRRVWADTESPSRDELLGVFFPTADQLATEKAGWSGTAFSSISSMGAFANGTTRTFMGWAYRNSDSTNDCLVGSSSTTDYAQLLLSASSTDVAWRPQNSGSWTTWASAWPGNDQWVHWALVYDETTNDASLYLNGDLVSTQTVANSYVNYPGYFQVGAVGGGTNSFDGRLAWTSAHSRALSADEIRAAFDAGVGQATLGPFLT